MVGRKLEIAQHEAGHAVMALIAGRRVLKISLRGMNSRHGSDPYHGFANLEPLELRPTIPIGEVIEKGIMVALGGFAAEILFLGDTALGGDDLKVAVNLTSNLLEDDAFRKFVGSLPNPEAGPLDLITDPTIRACIRSLIDSTVARLQPCKDLLNSIAERLCEKEELLSSEVEELFRAFTSIAVSHLIQKV